MWCVTVLFCAVNPGFSRCQRYQLNLLPGCQHNKPLGLIYRGQLQLPALRGKGITQGPGWPYVSRTIIFNETASNLSACGSRDARQIRPSEGPLLLTLIYGPASFPLPVMLCVSAAIMLCFTWFAVSGERWAV